MQASASLDRPRWDSDVPAAVLLLLVVVPLAAWLYGDFLGGARLLWRGLNHDRNGHFQFGVSLALDVLNRDVVAFLTDFNRATVWPPLHGLALAAVLLVGGVDDRLGVLPSLAGWVITVVVAALIARRLVARVADGPAHGTVAAALTVIFVAASPGLRDYALDVMLESLGAALTALALYCYLRAKAGPGQEKWWRRLALVLTLLFFEKGNYWGLLVAGVVLAELAADPRSALAAARAIAARLGTGAFWAAQARAPLTWVLVALLAIIAALLLRGPTSIPLFGRDVSLYPPENLATAACWVAFLRGVQVWRGARAEPTRLSPVPRIVIAWHILPIALWFLVPHRLTGFVWFVSPYNSGPAAHSDLIAGFGHYIDWATQLYHADVASAALAAALALVAAASLRRLAPGAGAVLATLAVSAIGVAVHPHQLPRFLGSWVAILWMLAGAGGAIVLAALPQALGPWWRRVIAAAAVAGLAWWHGSALMRAWQPPAWAGPAGASDLDLTALYLERVPTDRRLGIISTIGGQSFLTWTFLERARNPRNLALFKIPDWRNLAQQRAEITFWIRTAGVDTVVVIDAPDGRYDIPEIGLDTAATSAVVAETLAAEGSFVHAEPQMAPDGARVTLWTRRQAARAP
jgi:hypothetical protein